MAARAASSGEHNKANARLAADIGGTFTDIAVFDDKTGKISFGKALSTPARLVDGISAGVEKAGFELCRCAAVPPWLDGRDQHDPGAHRRAHGAGHHRRLSRHLRDRPHQPARRVQPLFQETRSADRARAALRGARSACCPTARSTSRSTRRKSRRWRNISAASTSRRRRSCSSTATATLTTRRAPRRSSSASIRGCSCRPRTNCRRNIVSSSAARRWRRTPISGRACATTSARSRTTPRRRVSAARC